jgi:hypothetical protein
VNATNPAALSRTLAAQQREAYLFRDLATLRSDIPLFGDIEALRWEGPRPEFEALAALLEAGRGTTAEKKNRKVATSAGPAGTG